MNTYRSPYFLGLFSALCILSSCSGAKDNLGLTKKAPDEFQVVRRAPLAMPPDYSLRPPEPGAPRPQEQSMVDTARATVFGEGAQTQTSGTASTAEETLLQQAGAAQANPDIRRVLDAEYTEVDQGGGGKPVIKRLMNIGGSDEVEGLAVDPAKEAERIKKNAESGQPVTEGETPSKED